MSVRRVAFTLALAVVLSATPAAYAQDEGVTVDPSASSPAGSVYEIPLESARRDAAPARPRRSDSPRAPAPITSENGYGSSSQVPGRQAAPTRSTDTEQQATGGSKGSTTKRSRSTKRRSTRSAPLTENALPPAPVPKRVLTASAPSETRSILLLVLAAGVGLLLAGAARLVVRRRG